MEFLVFIFVVGGPVFFLLKGRKTRQNPPPRTPQSKQPSKSAKSRASRFEQKSAHPVRRERVLAGAAWVTDGDTITIKRQQIRLYGIDAPELNHPYGQKAKWALHKLCKGQSIRVEITAEDAHGRVVARCYLPDGRDLSAEMVKQGLAIDWPKFSGGKYQNLETPDARKKLFLADARQKGWMHVWEKFEAKQCS